MTKSNGKSEKGKGKNMLPEEARKEHRKRVRSVDGGNLAWEVRKRTFVTIPNVVTALIAEL